MPQNTPVSVISPSRTSPLQVPVSLQATGSLATIGDGGGVVSFTNPAAPMVTVLAGSAGRDVVNANQPAPQAYKVP